METVRDMEALADRISQIRDGDYGDAYNEERDGASPGNDLKAVMTQLEDIRHGSGSGWTDEE